MKIYVKTVLEKTLLLDVEPSDSIQKLKEKIQQEVGIPPNKQQIIRAGK